MKYVLGFLLLASAASAAYFPGSFAFVGGCPSTCNLAVTGYIPVSGIHSSPINEVEVAEAHPRLRPHKLHCFVSAAPESGVGTQSYIFTIKRNDVATDCTCTISEANTECEDNSCSAIAASSRISNQVTIVGSPTNAYGGCYLIGSL